MDGSDLSPLVERTGHELTRNDAEPQRELRLVALHLLDEALGCLVCLAAAGAVDALG
jgi:hypothetical protein